MIYIKSQSPEYLINERCTKCHKPFTYVGDVPTGGFPKGMEPYCTCDSVEIIDNVSYGWICSRCGKSLSPFTKECDCTPNNNTITHTY